MTFLHKLAMRLARLRAAQVMGLVALTSCELLPARIMDPSGTVTRLDLSPPSMTVLVDRTTDFVAVGLTATGDTADVVVTWTASGGTITPMSSTDGRHYGRYRAPTQPGSYRVLASTAAGGPADSSVVSVSAVPVAAVTVSPGSADLTVGGTAQLTATPRDAAGAALAGRIISWSSSNQAAATVNGAGLVTGVGAGSATITATCEGQSGTASAAVTFVPVASVTVSPTSASLAVGATQQLAATPRDASGAVLTGRVITWGSSNTTAATVSGSGLVTARAAGTATITATSEGQSGTASVAVTFVPVASVTVTPGAPSISVSQTVQLTATPRDASGNALSGRVVTWATSGTAASVSGSGLVTGLVAGAATITATSEGQNGTANVTVTAAPPPPPGGAWPNEPSGFTMLTDNAWNVKVGGGWQSTGGSARVMADGAALQSPSNVLEFPFPIGFSSSGVGPDNLYYDFGANGHSDPTEMYVGFWFKASNPWQGHASGFNKIMFITTGGTQESVILEITGGANGPFQTAAVCELAPTVNRYENRNTGPFTLGVWHRIEVYLNYNGGILRWWVDGVLKGDYSGVPYGYNGFDGFKFQPTWGGVGGPTKQTNDYFRVDHVRASRR